MAGGVGPSSPFMASGEGPLLPFIGGGVGPHLPLVHGGVGPLLPFMPGAIGPSSSFGLGPSFAMWCWALVIVHGWCCWGLVIFHGWRCWGLVILFMGGGGVPLSCRSWVVVVCPCRFSCAVWSCRRSRVRVVGGCLCLWALHPSSSSLALSCIISVCCHRMSSSSHVLGIAFPCRVVVPCPPCCCPMLLLLPCPCCDMLFCCTTWHLC